MSDGGSLIVKSPTRFWLLILALLLISCANCYAKETVQRRKPAAHRTLSMAAFEGRVRGAWAGQMIGVTYGAPTEFRFLGKINEKPRDWKPEELAGALDQDDLYVEMTFTKVLDTVGLEATSEQFGEAFKDSKYRLWHANMAARRLLRRGIKAPLSGHPRYNFHANDIDFQIESDFIGLMCPGLPRAAQRIAARVGHVMNYGDGVYGGVFIAAMYSAAFFENDPRKVVQAGLAAIPSASGYARVIRDVLQWSAENPDDWKKTWNLIESKYDKHDVCPDGALMPFNIDASLNGAYVVLGLLYGNKDFDKTMEIAMRSGQDSDCNPSSAAGVLGAMIGYEAIPKKWTGALASIADKKFSYTDYSFNSIVASTLTRAKSEIERQGGSVAENRLAIPMQSPAALKLEQFLPGPPVERIGFGDRRWKFEGAWEDTKSDDFEHVKRSQTAGAKATASFGGTGAIVYGLIRPDGGLATVILDGERAGNIAAYYDEGDRTEGIWGKFDLPPGQHTVQVLIQGKPYPGSKGSWVYVKDLVAYRK